jgi:hypothetical protein
LDAALIAVGRLVGPGLVAFSGAQLCTSASSWAWFALGLVGAALTTARAVAPTKLEIEHVHLVSGSIDVAPVRVEMPEFEPEALEPRRVAEAPPTPASVPALSVVTNNDDAQAKMTDLASALVNLGYKKGLAGELAREAVTRAPNVPLEELIKVALRGKNG